MSADEKVAPIPPGPRLVPYLAVSDARAAIEFYVDVLGMQEDSRIEMDDGRIGHAELALGHAKLYVADEFPEIDIVGPATRGGTTVSLHLYVEDVDAVVAAALEAGATQEGATKNALHGDRTAKIVDPFGHRWLLATRIEEVSAEEIARRYGESNHA